jgi:hypothetical protein
MAEHLRFGGASERQSSALAINRRSGGEDKGQPQRNCSDEKAKQCHGSDLNGKRAAADHGPDSDLADGIAGDGAENGHRRI